MIEHTSRIESVVKAALKEAAMGEPVGFHVSFGYWPITDLQTGEMLGMSPAWFVCVTIRNGLAKDPLVAGLPLAGLLPSDEHFTGMARALLERARRDRDAQNQAALDAVKGKSLTGLIT